MGKSSIDDPRAMLSKLKECLLLGFSHHPELGRLALVLDYPEKGATADRTFVRCEFQGVRSYRREMGSDGNLAAAVDNFQARTLSRPVVVQSIRDAPAEEGRHLDLWFGVGFGGISFDYLSVAAQRRDALVETIEGDFMYRDAETHQIFDFYEPFPTASEIP